MSTWKLVEAEAITPINIDENKTSKNKGGNTHQSNNNYSSSNERHDRNERNNNNHNNNGNNNNGRRHSRERRRSGQGRKNREQESIESRQYYAHLAVQTLEYYFSPDSLICDTTIRSYLDEAGYIPIAFVCNFPEIIAIGAFYEDIVTALQKSTLFEVDVENETMRLHDWQKWLMPNGLGGFGLPRYIKQTANYEHYANAGEEWATNEVNNSNQQEIEIPSRDQELSPNATEYTPTSPSKKSASTTPTTTAEVAPTTQTTTESSTETTTTETTTTTPSTGN